MVRQSKEMDAKTDQQGAEGTRKVAKWEPNEPPRFAIFEMLESSKKYFDVFWKF